jgi:hypothetical protein
METKKQPPHINVDYFEDLTLAVSEQKEKGLEEVG